MPQPLAHLGAIRTRLINDPVLFGMVGKNASGDPAIYVAYIFDVAEPVYPAVTIRQLDGKLAVWAPRLIDPCRVQIDHYGKGDTGQNDVISLDDRLIDLLHTDKTHTSGPTACFHEIRRIDSNSPGTFDFNTETWHISSQYLVRVSTF